jgi:hypothetical protein
VVALVYTERHQRPGAVLDDRLELRVGVTQVTVGIDQGVIVRASLGYQVQQPAYGQTIDILGAHSFLLVSVPADVRSVAIDTLHASASHVIL